MRLLIDEVHGTPPGPLDPAGLAALYAWDEPSVRANMVASVDGAASGGDGKSGPLGGPADHEVFVLLRALCDVVLVGAGTTRTEGYSRPRTEARWGHLREGRAPHPAIVVVSRRGDVPESLLEARPDSGDVVLVTAGPGATGSRRADEVLVHEDGAGGVDLAAALDTLAARGLTRVLCEGGPHLLADVAAAGRLDELCLTVAPALIGADHPRILTGATAQARLDVVTLVESEGALLGRWRVRR